MLRVNKNCIDIPQGFIEALEILIKLNIFLNIQFPSELKLFYDFILGCIMKKFKPTDISKSLFDTLEAIHVENIESSDRSKKNESNEISKEKESTETNYDFDFDLDNLDLDNCIVNS